MRRAVLLLGVLSGCYPRLVVLESADRLNPSDRFNADGRLEDAADVLSDRAALDEGTQDDGHESDATELDMPTTDVLERDSVVEDSPMQICGTPNLLCPSSCNIPSDISCQQVRVAGGRFVQGENALTGNVWFGGPEQRDITVSAFIMDATEVTVERFRRFWNSTTPMTRPTRTVTYPNGAVVGVGEANRALILEPIAYALDHRAVWSNDPMTPEYNAYARHPIQAVNWYTAMSFCIWDGGRLPTESEWEFAARGRPLPMPVGRPYPWGNELPNCRLAVSTECVGGITPATLPVASAPSRIVEGIADLAGNASEMTASQFIEYGNMPANAPFNMVARVDPLFLNNARGLRVVRGGSAYNPTTFLRAAARSTMTLPDAVDFGRGFRCVRNPP
jgi:formylglycine-generating enzyme required for sulfatase activity